MDEVPSYECVLDLRTESPTGGSLDKKIEELAKGQVVVQPVPAPSISSRKRKQKRPERIPSPTQLPSWIPSRDDESPVREISCTASLPEDQLVFDSDQQQTLYDSDQADYSPASSVTTDAAPALGVEEARRLLMAGLGGIPLQFHPMMAFPVGVDGTPIFNPMGQLIGHSPYIQATRRANVPPEVALRRERETEAQRQRRRNQSEEQRHAARARQIEIQRQRRASETEEQRRARNARAAETQRRRRQNQSEEQRRARAERHNEAQRMRRMMQKQKPGDEMHLNGGEGGDFVYIKTEGVF